MALFLSMESLRKLSDLRRWFVPRQSLLAQGSCAFLLRAQLPPFHSRTFSFAIRASGVTALDLQVNAFHFLAVRGFVNAVLSLSLKIPVTVRLELEGERNPPSSLAQIFSLSLFKWRRGLRTSRADVDGQVLDVVSPSEQNCKEAE